jgi:uncharacterized protein DUF3768
MTHLQTIRHLNDTCRATGEECRIHKTSGIGALPPVDQLAIYQKVRDFNTFTHDNDPYHEHDFGSFEHEGNTVYWKIAYYAKDDFDHGSEDPADPAQTTRVLTIMLAKEY